MEQMKYKKDKPESKERGYLQGQVRKEWKEVGNGNRV